MTATAAAIAKQSNTSFYYSFSLLPRHKRDAIRTVYAFCRRTDDIVDEEADTSARTVLLTGWRSELGRALEGTSSSPLLNQLSATARKFNIPVVHFYDLIRGMEMDLTRTRYETFEELEEYCRLVASSVGLMCRQIFGYRKESTREYAVSLGIALQLTNILRDIADDAARGRIYIPQEDLRRFGCPEEDLLGGRYTPAFRTLMAFQVERARGYFARAQAILEREDKGCFFPARIMWSVYAHLLNRIERRGYNVFERRITLPRLLKVLITVRYWLSHRLRYS
ncbi:MAG: presqualene diphosphate synthase HpnD [Bacteroidota bacterium]